MHGWLVGIPRADGDVRPRVQVWPRAETGASEGADRIAYGGTHGGANRSAHESADRYANCSTFSSAYGDTHGSAGQANQRGV